MSEQKARRVNQERTSLATAIAGMKHWDWCPICRGGLDTGLECDQCGADLMPIYTAFKESLSGGNPGEPKACTGAEERGISGATGAGQHPDGKPGSTVDSAERRSPDGTERTPSPDESNRHLSSKSTVWMAKNRAYSETCYFGHYATAVAWARGGTVVPVEVQHYTPPALHVPKTDLLAEAVRMIQGYQRAGWLTNPAAGEQASDFIARASHEPPQPAEATECRYCDEVMKERDDYHEWADTLAYDIERLVGVEIGEHSNLNSPWGNEHDAAEYELDKRARKPHEPEGWRPIETAPADTDVLLYCPDRHYTNPERVELGQAKNTKGGSAHSWATHWMPLPSAPSTKDGEPT